MCVLHVTSLTKSFVSIITDSSLPVYQSYEKGDIRTIGKKSPYDDFGFSCDVSKRSWDDLSGQLDDAIQFLSLHQEELSHIIDSCEVDDIRLDFPYSNREMFMQCDYLSPELLKRTGDLGIGIELSLYPAEEQNTGEQNAAEQPATAPQSKPK